MKTKICLIVALAITVGATSVMAASLVPIPKVTNLYPDGTVQVGVYPRGITPDGRYVGGVAGLGYSSGGVDTGFVYDAATGVIGHIVAGGYQDTVDGIGYWTDGTTTKVVIEGSNAGWQSMNAWNTATAWDGVLQWDKVRRTNTHAYYGSGQNRMAGTSDSNNLLHGTFNKSATELFIDSYNGTGVVTTPDIKSTGEAAALNGVSNAGVAVGVRNNDMYKITYEGDGGAPGVYVNGAPDGTADGSLYDIADDGSIMGGYGHVTGKTGWYPCVFDGTTSFELPGLTSGSGYATNGAVYSISPNGDYAVGMDYTMGQEMAVMWDLRDMNNIVATDLTAFAAANGILGDFDGNLRRATGIGINGEGNPVITGVGVASSLEAGGYTGFVLTIPEPAGVVLLALGSLLLRRRR